MALATRAPPPNPGLMAPSVVVPLVAEANLLVRPPEGAPRDADDALPTVDVSNLEGARIAARLGYRSGPLALRVVCATAPANGWAPGVEEMVLARATQLAKETLGGELTRFTASAPAAVGPGFEQRFEGVVRRGDETLAVRGRHWLGFAGEPRDAIVCTVACTEPEPARACEALIADAVPVGAWVEAPPPNLLARTLLLAAERPNEAAGGLVVALLAVASLVIARRPRPRAT
jgi:hypothetical protein